MWINNEGSIGQNSIMSRGGLPLKILQHVVYCTMTMPTINLTLWSISFIDWLIDSFIHSFSHSFSLSFSHAVIQSSVRSFIHSFIHSLIRSFTHSFTHSFNSFIHSFVHSLVHSFIRSVVHSFIRSVVQSFIRSSFFLSFFLSFFFLSFVSFWAAAWTPENSTHPDQESWDNQELPELHVNPRCVYRFGWHFAKRLWRDSFNAGARPFPKVIRTAWQGLTEIYWNALLIVLSKGIVVNFGSAEPPMHCHFLTFLARFNMLQPLTVLPCPQEPVTLSITALH